MAKQCHSQSVYQKCKSFTKVLRQNMLILNGSQGRKVQGLIFFFFKKGDWTVAAPGFSFARLWCFTRPACGLPYAGETSDVHVSIVPPQKCILVRGEHESRILKHFQEGATLHPFPKSLNLDSFIRQCWWLAIIHKSSIFPRGIHKITTGGQKQKKESTWTQQEAGSEQMSCLFIKRVSVFPK